MKRTLTLLFISAVISFQCSSSHTVIVAKPRLHKSWPVTHKWHKKIKVWRIHIRLFERQGLKKVRMKGDSPRR